MTNGESLFYAEDEAGYLAGVLAASISKSNTIGVVGGLLVVPPVERFVEGYINGAKATKSDITVKFTYTSSFVEPEQGKAAAQQMIDAGADIIFAAGGLTGNGALLAACDAGKLAIGVDTDQFLTLPEAGPCLVSSATKDIVASLQGSLLRIATGKFTAGFTTNNAANLGIALAPFHDNADKVSVETVKLRPTRLSASRKARSRRWSWSTAKTSNTHSQRASDDGEATAASPSSFTGSGRGGMPVTESVAQSPGAAGRAQPAAVPPRSACGGSRRSSRASSPTTTSTSTSGRARSTPSSARTAPARARS
jgi:basic membrane lipoprotein Med (substrate-binding protein (PBP1-ABC) superfamily)